MATRRTVTVTGQGSASVVPDSAVLRVAAVHRGASVQDAFRGTASAVQALLDIAGAAVGEAAVASRGIDLWNASDREGRPAGFECRHAVTVRCPSLEEAGSLLGDLVERVGDRLQVEGVSLEVTDSSAADRRARAAAYADAEAKAGELAELAGTVVDGPLTIVEGGSVGGAFRAKDEALAAASMPIAAGERQVVASLTVTFTLA